MTQGSLNEGADYVAGGSVTVSTTKEVSGKGFAGYHSLKQEMIKLDQPNPNRPLVAIGGLNNRELIEDVIFAGADGAAAVSVFFETDSAEESEQVAEELALVAIQRLHA